MEKAKSLLWSCRGQTFMGIKVTQYRADLALWEKFLNGHGEIKTVIELGTERAGLALFLALQAYQRGMEFWTFDHKRPAELETPLARLLDLENKFMLGNLFGEAGQILVNILHAAPRPVLLFCDDGNKPREFREFVPHLLPGDYVGVHDWGMEFTEADAGIFAGRLEPLMWDYYDNVGSITRFMKVLDGKPAA